MERDFSIEKVSELSQAIDQLKMENSILAGNVEVVEETNKVSCIAPLNESPSSKMNKILCSQKSYGDKSGLGFYNETSTSKNASSDKGKLTFVLSSNVSIVEPRNDGKSKRVWVESRPIWKGRGVRNFNGPRNVPFDWGPPICHACGMDGHIRHFCWANGHRMPMFEDSYQKSYVSTPRSDMENIFFHN